MEPGAFDGLTAITDVVVYQNALTQQAVDAIVDEIHRARDSYDNSKPKFLLLSGGTNAAPSPSSVTKINELETDTYKWNVQ